MLSHNRGILVFIDPTIDNYSTLVKGIIPEAEGIVLDPRVDGVKQITQVLAGCRNIQAIHIVSHGSPGCLYLGNSQLNISTLQDYARDLQRWSEALTADADILIYGCNVAAELPTLLPQGISFIDWLSQLTGAKIAASANLTGSAALGGDWDLQVRTGEIKASSAFPADVMAAYDAVLASSSINPDDDLEQTVNLVTRPEAIIAAQSSSFQSFLNLADLNGSNGFVIEDIPGSDRRFSPAGDINNDGIDDLIISVPENPRGSYVVFGGSQVGATGIVELSDINGSNGFRIYGGNDFVRDAGDVNGDGMDDLMIGDAGAGPSGLGAISVVFGSSQVGATGALNPSDLDGSNGFRIYGVTDLGTGAIFGDVGDINNDGINDLIILKGSNGGANSAVVVFGDAQVGATGTVDPLALDGSNGFILESNSLRLSPSENAFSSGDLNGDGIDDLIIGASMADPNGKNEAGETYVIFGFGTSPVSANVTLERSHLNGNNGFVINGINAGDQSGFSVSYLGDINNDSVGDLLIGTGDAGESYVLFGGSQVGATGTRELSDLNGSNGFVINGVDVEDQSGFSVSSIGDMNHDGINDLLIGAPYADANGKSDAGVSYVVFGSSQIGSTGTLELSELNGSNGFAINGIHTDDESGFAVSNAGDINGDGVDDLMIADERGDSVDKFRDQDDYLYLVFGNAPPELDLNGSDSGINYTATFTATPTRITESGFTLTDLNSTTVANTTVQITNLLDGANEVLKANTIGTDITAHYNANTGMLSLAGVDTIANYQQVLGTVTYKNTATTPDTSDRTIEFVVNDGGTHSNLSSLATTTVSFNSAPNFTSTEITGVDEDNSYLYNITTSDADSGDTLTINATALPGWLNFTDNGDGTATLTGTPTNDQVGNHNVELVVTDSAGATDTQIFDITVANTNDAPTLTTAIPDQNTTTGSSVNWDISGNFTDIDVGDTLTYTATNLPTGLSLDTGTGIISGTVADSAIATHSITVTASDGNGGSVSDTFDVTVGNSLHSFFNLADIDGTNGFVINGSDDAYRLGVSVSDAGDINNDGIDDLMTRAHLVDSEGYIVAGETYVVFGGSQVGAGGTLQLSDLNGSNGFIINGIDANDLCNNPVSGAGDINNDGIDDLIIGVKTANPNGTSQAGKSYVVFGSSQVGAGGTLELSNLDGSNGFVLNGVDEDDYSGHSLSGAGDINGDGIDDLIIGANRADPDGKNAAGESYVVFGGSQVGAGGALELSSLNGTNGFAIKGIDTNDESGYSVSGAGDINEDGIDDLIIGALWAKSNGKDFSGQSYIVFGGVQVGAGGTLELSNLNGNNGFVINSIDRGNILGESVSNAGDINNDGIDDLIIGAPGARPNSNNFAGESYVVFGGSQVGASGILELSSLNGNNGFIIKGIDENDYSGVPVSHVGDINHDGIDDLIIGANRADPNSKEYAGESYVVFGGSNVGTSGILELSALNGSNGFVINGIDTENYSGYSVSGAGDINHDGVDDLIIGAPGAEPNGRQYAGQSYVVFGNASPQLDLNGSAAGINHTTTFTATPIPIVESGFTLTDFNSTTVANTTVQITNLLDGADEVLTANTSGTNITAQYNANTGMLSLAGVDTVANYQQVLGTVTYTNTATTPDTSDRTIEFVVNDGGTHSNLSSLATTTVSFNSAPNFTSTEITGVDEDNSYLYNITTSDADSGDTLTINATALPGWLNFTDNGDGTATLTGTPTNDQVGNHNVELVVTDSAGATDTQTFDITVANTNDAPTLTTAIPDQNTTTGSSVNWDISSNFIDIDVGDTLTYAATNLPTGLSLDTGTGIISGTVADSAIATHSITVTASDGNGGSISDTFDVTVGNSLHSFFNLANLNGNNGFIINGIHENNFSGVSVSDAGDINNDGIDDLIIRAHLFDSENTLIAGESYVVFGDTNVGVSGTLELSDLNGTNGFIITGIDPGDQLDDYSVSNAGDINNDGINDLIIGASTAQPNGTNKAGKSYVVFGHSQVGTGGSLDLSTLNGSNGFVINGIDEEDYSGSSVSNAGDVNNDGIDDLIIGAKLADPNGNIRAGESYVVFGGTTVGNSGILELSSLNGTNGFVINGFDAEDQSGTSVSHVGDINHDGINDIIIGAIGADPNNLVTGASYVVFGSSQVGVGGTLELSSLNGTNGFIINGIDPGDYSGISVSDAGDINNDGIDDLIIGAYVADPNSKSGAGESYVVFGGTTVGNSGTLELSSLDGSNGFVINGIDELDVSGQPVRAAGDINKDGIDDLIISAHNAAPNGKSEAGETYVVFGGTTVGASGTLELSSLNGSNGFVINGIDAGDYSGWSISYAGDVNKDGVDDIIIGTLGGDPNGESDAGESYVIFGNAPSELDLNGSAAGIDYTATFTATPIPIAESGFTLTDLNSTTVANTTVQITNLLDGADEVLSANTTGTNITAHYNANTGMLSLAGVDTVANYQQVLGTITYKNTAPAPDTTNRTIEFVVNDGGTHSNLSSLATTTVSFNSAPNFTSTEITGVDEDNSYLYNITTSDADSGDTLTINATALPGWLNFTDNGDGTATLTGTPTNDQVGNHNVELVVTDSAGATDTQTFDITVANTNDAPTLTTAIPDQNTTTGSSVNWDISSNFIDIDVGDTLTYAATNLPTGLSLDTGTGIISGTVADSAIATHSITVTASDGNGGSVSDTFDVTVGNGLHSFFNLADLNGTNGFMINGVNINDRSGRSVSSAGDINHDGIDDLIIGVYTKDPNDESQARETYVVFGGTTVGASGTLELSDLNGTNGFVINGIDSYEPSNLSVSNAGDINNDGIDDIIIGALYAAPNGKSKAGASYVVFGGTNVGTSGTLELSDLNGTNGFVLNGIDTDDLSGHSVSNAGDINNDGIADLIIGASGADPNSKDYAGESYVVFGGTNVGVTGTLELSDLNGTNGFVINGIDSYDRSGISVSKAGDINNDGIDDLIIGAVRANPNSNIDAGESYVVFGGSQVGANGTLELSSLNGTNGFVLNGIDRSDFSGWSVSHAGDINNDGIADLIIGAKHADPNGKDYAGESYVVFGGSQVGASGTLELSSLNGTNGFVLNGIDTNDSFGDFSGWSVSHAGDINHDNIDDLIIGARWAERNGKRYAGEGYVVFGGSQVGASGTLELSSLNGANGFIINSISGGSLGYSVSNAGDINSDGIDDLILGAPLAPANGKSRAGQSYVIFGNALPQLDLNGSAAGINHTATFTATPIPIVESGFTLTDFNSTTVANTTVQITNLLDGADEVLSANTTGTNITAHYNANTGMLSLAGVDTVANYQQVLGTVTYTNTATTPDTSDRTIEFVVNDGATHSNLSSLATTTVSFNSAPIANDDTVTTDEDTAVTITVLDNDSDPDNNTLNLSSIDTTNTQGIVTLNPDNTLTYNPDTAFQSLGQGETTTDSLTYTLSDGNGGTATATVTVTVTGINDTPTLTPVNKTGDEDTVISFSANDFTTAFNDPEGTSLNQISVISLPNQGVLNLNGNTVQAGDEITVADLDNLTFTPDADFNGNTSFVWNASDGTNFAAGTTVNMTINAVNDNPVAIDDSATTTQDTAITINVLANDSDPVEADPLHIDAFDSTSASGGTIILNDNSTPNDLTDDQLLYTPATGYIGADSFSYTISDSNGGTATATVDVTVNPANSLTLIGTPQDDTLTADSGDDFLFGLGGNDVLQAKAGDDFGDGGAGDDVLSGDAGQDNLFGNLGNDLLDGGEGEDALDGGDGDDMLFGGQENDLLLGQLGNDFLDGGDGNDYLDSGEGNDQVFGGNGNDMLLGNLGADFLRGGAGNDLLEAGEGNDILFGDADNDTLTGGAGDDLIRGDNGDDLLDGGVGNDGLFGGSGADQFLLRMGEGMDMVFDFSDGEDLFLLADGLTFDQLTITASSFSALIQVQSSGELLATVFGVSANLITATDFT